MSAVDATTRPAGARRAVLAGLAVLLAIAIPNPAGAADVFAVADVPVDATAANAVAAREAARLDGERRAFRILGERLTLAADQGRLPRPSDQRLTEMVRDFEVAGERSSAVRYLANLSFRFRPEQVRAELRNAGLRFTETVSKPVVVLPVLHENGGSNLWDDPNPWRDAWANRRAQGGLVPIVLPLGDAADLAAINAEQAVAADGSALAAIEKRADAGDALIAEATRGAAGESVTTVVRRVSAGGSVDIAKASFAPNPGESDADLMSRAAAATAAAVEEAWKRDTMLDTSQQGVLTAEVPVHDLGDWLFVRDRLSGIPAITSSDVIALGRQAARVEIHYVGDPARLRLALAQRDLALAGAEGSWTISRQDAGSR